MKYVVRVGWLRIVSTISGAQSEAVAVSRGNVSTGTALGGQTVASRAEEECVITVWSRSVLVEVFGYSSAIFALWGILYSPASSITHKKATVC